MHPHGVRYTPDYDGAYLGEYTRVGRLRRPRRGVHLHVGVHAGLGRRLAVPRPRPQPHAQHVPRAVRRDRRPRARRQGARRRAGAVPAPAARRRSPACRAPSSASTAARRGQHADAPGARRPGRRDPRDRDGRQLPRLPHPRPPLEGRRRARSSTRPTVGPERDDHRHASPRTTRAAGSTTATSSPIRTRAWRAGTSSALSRRGGAAHAHDRRSPPLVAAALLAARRRARADLPGAQGARARSRRSPRARTRPTRSASRRGCDFRTIQAAVNKAKAGDKITRQATAPTARP